MMSERDREIIQRHRDERTEVVRQELERAIPAVAEVVRALAPVLQAFARDVSTAAQKMSEAFGLPNPNACALCGYGEGPADHDGHHNYEPPSDGVRYVRMTIRRRRERAARAATRQARTRWRARVKMADSDRKRREQPTERDVARTADALSERERAALLAVRAATTTALTPAASVGTLELAGIVRSAAGSPGLVLTPLGARVAEEILQDTRTPEERDLNRYGLTSVPFSEAPPGRILDLRNVRGRL